MVERLAFRRVMCTSTLRFAASRPSQQHSGGSSRFADGLEPEIGEAEDDSSGSRTRHAQEVFDIGFTRKLSPGRGGRRDVARELRVFRVHQPDRRG